MRAPRNMTGPRRASDGSNTGSKSRAAPAKPTSNKMPTRSVGKPVGKRVGRSTPTTRSKPSTPKQYTRRVDSRGNISSTPTRKTTSAPSAANKRNAALAKLRTQTRTPPTSSRSSLAQKPTAAPARPTRAPARPAQTRRPTTSSANPYQKAYQRAMGKRQEGIKPSNYKAQTRRPTTSSRSSPAQRPTAARRRNPMTGRRSAHLSRMARGRRR